MKNFNPNVLWISLTLSYRMENQIKTFRFKFAESTIEKMKSFARIHCYDTREDFKEAWKEWKEEHMDTIRKEEKRHEEMGYQAIQCIEDKMYKSIRYYYVKQYRRERGMDTKEETSLWKKRNEKSLSDPTSRRKYIPLTKKIRLMMDYYIQQCIENDSYKPSKDYERFYKDPLIQQHLTKEVDTIREKYNLNEEDIREKIKKTYKNRYYMIRTKYIVD